MITGPGRTGQKAEAQARVQQMHFQVKVLLSFPTLKFVFPPPLQKILLHDEIILTITSSQHPLLQVFTPWT